MNTEYVHRYALRGRKDEHWYEECEKVFVDIFGADKLKLVAQLFAATSINTSLKSNIRLFRKALWEIQNHKPIGNYLPNIKLQLERIREGKELSGRKITNFAKAMSGDTEAVVVDIWICRAFGLTKTGKFSPSNKEYTEIEEWIKAERSSPFSTKRILCNDLGRCEDGNQRR